jgi:hypothetical protein
MRNGLMRVDIAWKARGAACMNDPYPPVPIHCRHGLPTSIGPCAGGKKPSKPVRGDTKTAGSSSSHGQGSKNKLDSPPARPAKRARQVHIAACRTGGVQGGVPTHPVKSTGRCCALQAEPGQAGPVRIASLLHASDSDFE